MFPKFCIIVNVLVPFINYKLAIYFKKHISALHLTQQLKKCSTKVKSENRPRFTPPRSVTQCASWLWPPTLVTWTAHAYCHIPRNPEMQTIFCTIDIAFSTTLIKYYFADKFWLLYIWAFNIDFRCQNNINICFEIIIENKQLSPRLVTQNQY